MQYIFLFLAFCAECTLRPFYINTTLTVEIIFITYFIILLKTNRSVSAWIPATLILISNFIRNEVLGLQSILLMILTLIYYYIFIKNQDKTIIKMQNVKKILTNKIAITTFMTLFFIFTLLQAVVLQIMNVDIAFVSETLYYILNIFVFIVIALCI